MPFDKKYMLCLELLSDIETIEMDRSAWIDLEKGAFAILRTPDTDISAVIVAVSDSGAEVELVAFSRHSVVYSGSIFFLAADTEEVYPLRLAQGQEALVRLSYKKQERIPFGKESVCPSC